MILVVTGGRDFADRVLVFRVLDRFAATVQPITKIVTGACVTSCAYGKDLAGVDRFALEWAWNREIDFDGRPARWAADGYPQAGPVRNERMLREVVNGGLCRPSLLVFPGGRGTANCQKTGQHLGFVVYDWSAFA